VRLGFSVPTSFFESTYYYHRLLGAFPEAEEHYWRALAIKEKLLGADPPDAALTRHNLGNLLNRTGRVAEAVPLLEGAVAVL
jgi:eukaryotic-like serine/threonine-protein kinase